MLEAAQNLSGPSAGRCEQAGHDWHSVLHELGSAQVSCKEVFEQHLPKGPSLPRCTPQRTARGHRSQGCQPGVRWLQRRFWLFALLYLGLTLIQWDLLGVRVRAGEVPCQHLTQAGSSQVSSTTQLHSSS